MGFHWFCDQERIAALAGKAPEFRSPNRADFTKGHFAHDGKRPGEPSHYGAQMLALAGSLARSGAYDPADYAASLREWFGHGGRWSGHIDRPTRATLDAMAAAEEAKDAPLTACGADDAQLSAVSKPPPLAARHHGQDGLASMVESAVRITNDRDDAAAWGRAVAAMIGAAIDGAAPEACIDAARGDEAMIDGQIDAALAMREKTPEEVATAFALHCQLEMAFPVVIHLIATAQSFAEAARANIRAGGDSCGRAIPTGAVLGACFAGDEARGVPADWLARVEVPGALLAVV